MSRASKRIKKEKIFVFEINALNSILNGKVDFVVCPICGDKYTNIKEMTLEHVPPKSQCGKDIVLTCFNCNLKAGGLIDAELDNQKIIENILIATKKTQKVKLKIEGIDLNATVTTPKPLKLEIKIEKKINCPSNTELFEKLAHEMSIKNTWGKCKFNITPYKKYNTRLADIGYLKSAFLISFAKFGFRYALDNKLNDIRAQIKYPYEKIIDKFCFISSDMNMKGNKIVIVKEPFRFLSIQFDRRVIFLPFLDSSEDLYSRIEVLVSEAGAYSGSAFPFPERPEFYFDFIK